MISNTNNKLSNKSILALVFAIFSLFIIICVIVFSFVNHNQTNSKATAATEIDNYFAKNTYTILAAGKDTASGLTDVLLLINVEAKPGRVNVIQIPRDTFLMCPGKTKCKINSASHILGGLDQLAVLLENAWKIEIDHTVEFTLDTFSRFIDLLGGVEINVPCDMNYEDPYQGLSIHLKAGNQLLYGKEAVQFVRYRAGYIQGDIARIDAQKIFIAAFAKKIKSGLSPFRIPAIAGALIGEVNTDLSLRQCIYLANLVLNIDVTNITLTTLPGEAARTKENSGAWYYIINRNATFKVIKKYFYPDAVESNDMNFDSDHIFSSPSYSHFEKIYYADQYSINEYTADDIIKNGIDIDLTKE